jgi:hypothetical protein
MAAVEIDSEGAAGVTVGGNRVEEAGIHVDGDKVPARTEGAFGEVLNKEHAVGTGEDGVIEGRGRRDRF